MAEDSHVKEHWLIVSEDLGHAYHFAQQNVQDIMLPELETLGCKVNVLHQRTEGCAAQYKSRHSFADISKSEQDLNVQRFVNFSARGHGTGEVDQAAGFLKTEARQAVITN